MSKVNNRSRVQNVLIPLSLGLVLLITATAEQGSSFVDSLREFFGFQSTEIVAPVTQPLTMFGTTTVDMSTLSYTEDFADVANWTADFAAGTGTGPFRSYPITAGGSANDGVRTTKSSAVFASGSGGGVQKGTASIDS